MLKIPDLIVDDSKAQKIITKHISEQIKELLKDVADTCIIDIENFDGDDTSLIDYLRYFFPEGYPEDKMSEMFFGLYALLNSEEEYVPKLAMEYLMAGLLEGHIIVCEDLGLNTRILVKEEREYLVECIRQEVIASEDSDEYGTVNENVDYYMRSIECIEEYMETCFWDADYMLLSSYTEEELMESEVNERFGIGLEDRERFVVPTKWLK